MTNPISKYLIPIFVKVFKVISESIVFFCPKIHIFSFRHLFFWPSILLWRYVSTMDSCSVASIVANSLWTHGLPGASVHGIHQVRFWSGSPCPPPGCIYHKKVSKRKTILTHTHIHTSKLGHDPEFLSLPQKVAYHKSKESLQKQHIFAKLKIRKNI